jgi:hypothetical protein
MLTPKQNFLKILQNGKPEYMMGAWDANVTAFGSACLTDPYTARDYPAWEPGTQGIDSWGVRWVWEPGEPGAHPSLLPEDIVVKDITRWREQLVLPKFIGADWSEALEPLAGIDRDRQMVWFIFFPGILERARDLLGFESLMVAFYENPDELRELLGAICDAKLAIFAELWEHYKPDFIHSHDDWGLKTSLYTSADMWREFIKPLYQRFYGAIKAKGVRISHHADCYCAPLVLDMVELGIDIWQGVTPQNDIPAIQRCVAGKLALMGGIDSSVVDKVGATEQEIRGEVRRCLGEYCPGGYFIPCVTSEMAFTPGVQDIVDDEIRAGSIDVYY